MQRLVTRVEVSIGEFTKIIDDKINNAVQPDKIDKYGTIIKSISNDKLMPASSVDLAFSVAPTIYNEFSKIFEKLTFNKILDLSVELGDMFNITYKEQSGTYRVTDIQTDFNKKQTTLGVIK